MQSIPTLNVSNESKVTRNLSDKQYTIVEFLKKNPSEAQTYEAIKKETSIDLYKDIQLETNLRSNQKIFYSPNPPKLQYEAEFHISNKNEFLNLVNRRPMGISFSSIKDCYPQIEADLSVMIDGGEIIAIKNNDLKTFVLYPRKTLFLTELSGDVQIEPLNNIANELNNETQKYSEATKDSSLPTDFLKEIRRGEAVLIGESWYRVSSTIRKGLEREQLKRSKPPLSVTLNKELSILNEYTDEFTKGKLPLHKPYSGTKPFKGKAMRHGCTLDVKELWRKAFDDDKVKDVIIDEFRVTQELVRHNLIPPRKNQDDSAAKRRATIAGDKNTKKRRKTRATVDIDKSHNSHLAGLEIADILKETRQNSES